MEPLVFESSSTDACSQSRLCLALPCPALHLSRVPFTLRISLILNKGIKLLFQLFLPLKARLSKGANCHFSVAPAAVLAATQAAGTLF